VRKKKIFFIATRIAGTDGVSLECEHLRDIFLRMGWDVTFLAGQLDRPGFVVPELFFQSPEIVKVHDRVVWGNSNFSEVEAKIFALAGKIEGKLREIVGNGNKPDLLFVPNVLSLPVHFPLAVAVTRIIEEFKIPTIARHHDFWWERERFLKSDCFPFFKRWFPPNLPFIKHVTINSFAQTELKIRTGLQSELIWDTFDFDSDIQKSDSYSKKWRSDFNITESDIVFLQATRIVPRKRIEIAIDLVKKLGNPKIVLVIAGYSGDEGKEYEKKLKKLAKKSGIRYRFIGGSVNARRKLLKRVIKGREIKRRIYTLWDCFRNCDFVVYPTAFEGFGNQFVETMYFKKPIVLTPYAVYKKDIKPLGFETIEITKDVGESAISKINELLGNTEEIKRITETNFKLGEKYLSYNFTQKKLEKLLS